MKLRVLDLFSGIGGFSLGLERTGGFETVAFCEIEDYPRRVLAKHWPGVPIYDDVRTLTADTLARDGIAVDVICGGFPCQDLSAAGNLAGIDGERSGLWSEIARLVGELRPRFIVVENVANLLSGPSERPGQWFGRVLGDLAALGYDAEWNCIPAAAVGAPHRRDRVWLIAYPCEVRRDAGRPWEPLQGSRLVGEAFADQPLANADKGRQPWGWEYRISPERASDQAPSCGEMADATGQRRGEAGQFRRNESPERAGGGITSLSNSVRQGLAHGGRPEQQEGAPICCWRTALSESQRRSGSQWAFEPELGRVANGISNRVERVAALGNAVVPQIPELIGRAILKAEGIA
jgi:DNA (cytosine-5)-methyltransferase 1